MHTDLPIFVLGTVLFPGGVLPLRVFEARYVDMVRRCLREDSPFGVCLLVRGTEVGSPAEHEPVGCLARIGDWDMQQAGVLQIRALGTSRFRIQQRRVAADGLVRADALAIDDDPSLPVPAQHRPCAELVRRLVQTLSAQQPDPQARLIIEPYRYEDAGWVANRLAEFLPMAGAARQALMVLQDPQARLAEVHRWLVQNKAL